MKRISTIVLAVLLSVMLCFGTAAEGPHDFLADLDQDYYSKLKGQDVTINVYNWGEYIANGEDDTLNVNKAFEELTGIKVNYTNYATNEELYAKLRSGGVSYDVIIPSDYMIARMASEDMLEKVDQNNIPNLQYINPDLRGMSFDPKDEYSVPYTWGSVVIIYNTKLVDANEDVDTWNLLWNEKYADQILMFNNPRDAFGIAQKKLGLTLNPKSVKEIEEAAEQLKLQKPVVQAYVMDEIFDKMGSGEAAIAPYYAGDALIMQSENPDLAIAMPREGTNIFLDGMCIPKGAKNKLAAEMYINFMLEPQVGAATAEYIGYSTPNLASLELLDEEITSNEISYPSDEMMKKMEFFEALPTELNRAMDDQWKNILSDDASFSFWLVPVLLVLGIIFSIVIVMRKAAKKRRQSY